MTDTSRRTALAQRILAVLPQTQCTRCGYADCAAYAQAIAQGECGINRCPPGGEEGIARLSALTGQVPVALDPQCGAQTPRSVVFIDEDWCIGCTLCIKACPVDAIVGSNQRMHTVLESQCTGCMLCVPVCPVDCIVEENASGSRSGWDAWSQERADQARQRYQARGLRLARAAQELQERNLDKAQRKLQDLAAHSRIDDTAVLEQKKARIAAALQQARSRRAPESKPS